MSVCPSRRAAGLRLARRLSAETLRQAGWTGKEPLRVYLAERQEQAPRVEPEKRAPRSEPPRTGDAVLDALIEAGAVSAERTEDGPSVLVRFRRTSRSPSRRPSCCAARSRGERCSTGKQKAQPNRLRPQKWIDFTFTIAFASR